MKTRTGKKGKTASRYIISKVILDKRKQQWVIDQLDGEGPKHKIFQNRLLFEQLTKFVKTVEKMTDSSLKAEKGIAVYWGKHEERIDFPISLPEKTLSHEGDQNKAISLFAEGPEHETLMYSSVLQVLAWADERLKTF